MSAGTTPVTGAGRDAVSLKRLVHRRLAERHDRQAFDGPEGRARLGAVIAELLHEEAPLLPARAGEELVVALTDEVLGLGPVEPLLADRDVTEIMLNGPGRAWVERRGRVEPLELDLDVPALRRLVERAVTPLGLRFDRSTPVVDARLPDGSRLHAVAPPSAVDGPYVTIRRFATRDLPLEAFTGDPDLVHLLAWAVAAGWNLLVCGGTSSGKTTLLNALSACLPPRERIVTIEETAELRLPQPHVVRLEARPPNAEGAGEVSVRDLVRAALRMRPERIVVGEVRGPEALDMVEALNTGHDGSLSTIHANGPAEALLRLEALALRAAGNLPVDAVRAQVATSIDAVVHVARRPDGGRVIEAVGEVHGGPEGVATRPLYGAARGAVTPARPPRRFDAPGPPC